MTNKILYLSMVLLLAGSGMRAQQLRGVDFSILQASPLDSALLRKNSTMYSARGPYGQENDNKATIFWKWAKDKERYYPVMREAWKYCLEKAPYQLRLYLDGADFYETMMNAAEDSVQRAKYYDELMGVYDLRMERLDSINAHVKRVSDKASRGSLMMRKVYAYDALIVKKQEGEDNFSPRRMALLMPRYAEAMDSIKQSIERGDDNGEMDTWGFQYYFGCAFARFAEAWNEWVASEKDSVAMRKRDAAKAAILNEYNLMRDFCDSQIGNLSEDYKDTESETGGDSIEVVQQKVVAPYKQLQAYCDAQMQKLEKANILSVTIQTLADAMNKYDGELESHKDSLAWLYRLKTACERTPDCVPDNYMYYPFYEDVVQYFEKALKKANEDGRVVKRYKIDPNREKADAIFKQLEKIKKLDDSAFQRACLCVYYYRKARGSDGGNASYYESCINCLRPGIRTGAFDRGLTSPGKPTFSITVNGITINNLP